MIRRRFAAAFAIAAVLAMSLGPSTALAALEPGQLWVQRIVSGFDAPVALTNARDGTNRLFVVERIGKIRTVTGTTISPTVYLDLRSKVLAGGERGLLGLAFHPNYRSNHQLFVIYTRQGDGAIVLSRLTANGAGTQVGPATERILNVFPHPTFGNHNGGGIAFGPDGYLYVGTGDGGGQGDELRNAQDNGKYLGKILRLNVDGRNAGPNDEYSVPTDNPYVGKAGLDEIWARGLRNPWRLTFDRVTGSMYVGDVGQGRYEEIDRESPESNGGRNYGWPVWEGKHCYPDGFSCSATGYFKPVSEYHHGATGNCSITGGYVYRGKAYPDLRGLYVLADYCSGRIWTMPAAGTSLTLRRTVNLQITSFGESEGGELFLVTLGGSLYRVTAG